MRWRCGVRKVDRRRWLGGALVVLWALAAAAQAQDAGEQSSGAERLRDTLLLRDYNTRVVVLGVTSLGLSAGVVGAFMCLRKRALLGDAISHATLPGIAAAFMIAASLGLAGKSLPVLLLGATVSGVLGVLCILAIVHLTRIKEDAALGIVLSVFFGAGIALMGIVQNMGTGHAAGLKSFIYGKAASMLAGDALLIAVVGVAAVALCLALYKELTLLCFDSALAGAQGWPVVLLDIVMMALVVCVTVIGLQAVGLILMIALLVVPPAAARFWTERLPRMMAVSAAIGAVSGLIGTLLSALIPKLPSGAMVVLVAGVLFAASLVLGPARGVLARLIRHQMLARRIARQHLLRAMYELSEQAGGRPRTVNLRELRRLRSWSAVELHGRLRAAVRDGLIEPAAGDEYVLTEAGRQAAWRVTRNHRLWELFLITHADIAPSHVDRGADQVEHVLEEPMVDQLERLLADSHPDLMNPPSPHRLAVEAEGGAAR